jgi:kynurenine formamidase
MHRVILGAGIVSMEGLTNLGTLQPQQQVPFYARGY